MAKALALIAAAAVAAAAGLMVVCPLMSGVLWGLPSFLPWQTPAVVFAEYAAMGLIHGVQALQKWRSGDIASAVFHTLSAALGFVFPSYYLHHDMRLHHSFYGLLMMALPWRPEFLGSVVTLDSFMYLVEPHYYVNDFVNLMVDHFPMFFQGYGAATLENDVLNLI